MINYNFEIEKQAIKRSLEKKNQAAKDKITRKNNQEDYDNYLEQLSIWRIK